MKVVQIIASYKLESFQQQQKKRTKNKREDEEMKNKSWMPNI